MTIHLPKDVMLYPDFRYTDKDQKERDRELEDWLANLCRSIEEYFKKARMDIEVGASTHLILSSIPSVTDVDEGEIVFYDNGATRRGYTKLNGSLRYWTLT